MLPSHYRLRQFLLSTLGLRRIPRPGSLASRLRERLLTCGWPDNTGFHAQGGQDRFVDQLILKGQRKGTFVEIGANDGETFSNCLFFEEQRAWSGVCIEPNPVAFAKLEKRRPEADNLNILIGPECETVAFPIVSDPEESLYASREKSSEEGSVELRQLDLPTLFAEAGLDHIDLLSLDVEGGEEDILATLAETEIRPRVVCVEENTTPETLDHLMRELGYTLEARLWPDRIYRHS